MELLPDEERQMKTMTVCIRLEEEREVTRAKIGSVFKDVGVHDEVYGEKESRRDPEEFAVDNRYSQEEKNRKSEEQVEEITEPSSLIRKMGLGDEIYTRSREESKGKEKLDNLKEDRKNCEEEGLCLNAVASAYQKEEIMKVENVDEDAVNMQGEEEPSKLRRTDFAMAKAIKEGTSANSIALSDNRRKFNIVECDEDESKEVVSVESDLEDREYEENSPGGSEGFEIHIAPCEISMQIDRKLQSAQKMLFNDHSQCNLENFIQRKPPIRREIGEKIEDVVEGK